jgi:hypothetical protein
VTDEQKVAKPKRDKAILILLGAMALAASSVIVIEHDLHKTKQVPDETCVAGADEQCPPSDWLKSYDDFKREKDTYDKKMKDLQDEFAARVKSEGLDRESKLINGWAQDLGKAVPPGYTVNEKQKKWVKPGLQAQPTPEKK